MVRRIGGEEGVERKVDMEMEIYGDSDVYAYIGMEIMG